MRYTKAFLTARADRTFKALGLDTGPAYDKETGKARIGATYIAKSFSGWNVEQIVNEGGGVKQLNGWCNTLTAAELSAFLDGMLLAHDIITKAKG